MPSAWISFAVTRCAPQRLAVSTSKGRALPTPRMPTLDDAGDMWHLARPAHGAGIAQGLAITLVAPVDMGIDLQDPDWAMIGKAGDEGDRHGIIAPDHQRCGAGGEDGARLLFDQLAVSRIVEDRRR
jgi:hypothetical protein